MSRFHLRHGWKGPSDCPYCYRSVTHTLLDWAAEAMAEGDETASNRFMDLIYERVKACDPETGPGFTEFHEWPAGRLAADNATRRHNEGA